MGNRKKIVREISEKPVNYEKEKETDIVQHLRVVKITAVSHVRK